MGSYITTSDGVKLYVQVKSSGAPCLYIHGGPGSGSYWMEKFSDGMLERHFQMIYLDQRGVARSGSPASGDFSLDRMAQDYEEVRAALGIAQWLTMGHSFAGILQMGYALRSPQALKGMLMLNCGLDLTHSFNESWGPKACEFLGIGDTSWYLDKTVPVWERMNSLGRQMRERDLFWKMAYADQRSEAIMNATFDEIPNWNGDYDEHVQAFPEYFQDFSQATAEIDLPVLFFYGLTDWMVGPEHYRKAHFPNMLLWPSEVGHIAIMENRADLEKALTRYQEVYGL